MKIPTPWCKKFDCPIDEVGARCDEECIGEGQDDCKHLTVK